MPSLLDLLPPERWDAPKEIHKDAWLRYGQFYPHHWINDGRLNPLALYCHLKARFGRPNGPTMALRHWSTQNLYQWHFVVSRGDSVIHFISRTDYLEIVPQIDAPATPAQWTDFIEAVKADFARMGPDISKARRQLEPWDLFLNPFARLTGIVDQIEQQLNGRTIPPPPAIPSIVDKSGAEQVSPAMRAFLDNATSLKVAALSARMLAPVWAESFVNLLIFVLGKPELKADARVYDNAFRQQIDVRVTSLHLNCSGIKAQVDRSRKEFKEFHTLMNSRNDLLHGNVNPTALPCGSVWFDRVRYDRNQPAHQIPLFDDEKNLAFRLLEGGFADIDPTHAMKDIGIVRAFIRLLLNYVKDEYRESVAMAMQSEILGCHKVEKRVGILFGNFMPVGIVGDRSNEQ
jgi:hypothetical protein